MWYLVNSWKLLSENPQAPPEKLHCPLKTEKVQVPPFLATLKIFEAPLPLLQKGGRTLWKMLFNSRIIITFYSFPSECRTFQVLTHSDLKMMFSFVIIGSIAATRLKFVNNTRTKEQWNFVFKCKKVTNFALSLESKQDKSLFFIRHICRGNLPKYTQTFKRFCNFRFCVLSWCEMDLSLATRNKEQI